MVGATILVAFMLLGWMVLRFSDVPLRAFQKPQIPVELYASGADGISEGSAVYYLGVGVGRVTSIRLNPDKRSVIIDVIVDQVPPLPENVEGIIRTQLLGGGSSINLVLQQPETASDILATQPTETVLKPVPRGQMKPNQRIIARYVGVDLMPPEISALAKELGVTSQELRRTAQKLRESDLIGKLVATVDTLNKDVVKAGDVLEKIDSFVGDEAMRRNVREALANFNDVSQTAKRIGQNFEKLSADTQGRMNQLADRGDKVLSTTQAKVEDLSKQVGDRLAQTAKILAELESISKKINDGKGTAGMLINNSALYETLLDTSKELKLTIEDVRRVIEQWEQEGVPLKLK
ncbi:MAG: MlaD family protein [Planctomycetota bacterium]|nr:MlaD family protein [Planctomycetota bacterium]